MIPAYSSIFPNSPDPVGLEILIPHIEYSPAWNHFSPQEVIRMAILALYKQYLPANSSSIHQYLKGSLSMLDIVENLGVMRDHLVNYDWGKSQTGSNTLNYTIAPREIGFVENLLQAAEFLDKNSVPK
jgi:hypothetical protein